jgi:hypothetical protein
VDTLSGIYIIYNGIEELQYSNIGKIDIIPNPNKGEFLLSVVKSGGQVEIDELEIWDMEGRLIRNIPEHFIGAKYEKHINVSELGAGVYIIKLKNKDEIGLERIIIQR